LLTVIVGAGVVVITAERRPRYTGVVNAGLRPRAGVQIVALGVLVAAGFDRGVHTRPSLAAVRGADVFVVTAERRPRHACVVNAGLRPRAGVQVVALGVLVAAGFDRGVHTRPSLTAVRGARIFIITVERRPRGAARASIADLYSVTRIIVVTKIFVGQIVAVIIDAVADLLCRSISRAWTEPRG